MSYFEGYDKELADKEREEAEMIANNEYQKELDEGLPHIERLADGLWVGRIVVRQQEMKFYFERLQQKMFESIEKIGDNKSNYFNSKTEMRKDELLKETILIMEFRRKK